MFRERINLRVSSPEKKDLLKKVSELAKAEGRELDADSSACVWWGLDRVKWALEIITEQQERELYFRKARGSLK